MEYGLRIIDDNGIDSLTQFNSSTYDITLCRKIGGSIFSTRAWFVCKEIQTSFGIIPSRRYYYSSLPNIVNYLILSYLLWFASFYQPDVEDYSYWYCFYYYCYCYCYYYTMALLYDCRSCYSQGRNRSKWNRFVYQA